MANYFSSGSLRWFWKAHKLYNKNSTEKHSFNKLKLDGCFCAPKTCLPQKHVSPMAVIVIWDLKSWVWPWTKLVVTLYQYGEPCHDSFKDHTSGSKVMEQTRFVTDRQNVQTHQLVLANTKCLQQIINKVTRMVSFFPHKKYVLQFHSYLWNKPYSIRSARYLVGTNLC